MGATGKRLWPQPLPVRPAAFARQTSPTSLQHRQPALAARNGGQALHESWSRHRLVVTAMATVAA
jgi:hypothetical protein